MSCSTRLPGQASRTGVTNLLADKVTPIAVTFDGRKQIQRWIFELNCDLAHLLRKPLAGSQKKRHTSPAPIVEGHTHRHKRFTI